MKGFFLISMLMLTGFCLGTLPPLKMKGMKMVDPAGKAVTLKGVNLGNWLVIEMWMLGLADQPGNPGDQFELEKLLAERFGEPEKDRLMDVYRSHWVTERDFELIPKFGFNLVRLPMNYRLMEDDRKPFQLKANAWKWIDRAVDLSEKHGLYVILDMHGAQGGQSPYDHTGHSDQNHLQDDPEAQKRLAWLWGEIAKRYRDRGAVVAYDVFNEPYGTPKDIQVKVFRMALEQIRKNDPDKLVFAHGNYDDFQHYGDPKANGWKNVGFQMHYYPGLFGGGPPTVKTHMRHLQFLEGLDKTVKKYDVPFLIGEMNVVFSSAGGAEMMQRYFETHAKYGWMTTMWAWKVVSGSGGIEPAIWGCVVNKDPMRKIDFRKASAAEIESYFQKFATEPLAVFEELRARLAGEKGPTPELPSLPPPRTSAPQEELPGWNQVDLGTALKGGLENLSAGRFALFGGGSDAWGREDHARFLYKPIEGDFELEVEIHSIEDVHQYAKAGLMIRAGEAKDAAAVILTSFFDGEVQFAHRDKAGAEMQGSETVKGSLPGLRLKLVRKDGKIAGWTSDRGSEWKLVASAEDTLPRTVLAGSLALSHENGQLVQIIYRNLKLTRGS